MLDTKDKIKAGVDNAASKAKEAAEKVVDKTEDAAHTAGEKVKQLGQYDAMAEVKDQAKGSIDEGASKAKKVTDSVGSTAEETLSQLRDWAEPALERAQAGYRQVAKHTKEGVQRVGEIVSANPGMSVSAAFGFGLALGVIITMSLRPPKRHGFASHFHRPSWLS
jgi:ElaB/YqjD/DUF883 family membrane-anchored ribosome-binding protein